MDKEEGELEDRKPARGKRWSHGWRLMVRKGKREQRTAREGLHDIKEGHTRKSRQKIWPLDRELNNFLQGIKANLTILVSLLFSLSASRGTAPCGYFPPTGYPVVTYGACNGTPLCVILRMVLESRISQRP